MTPLKGHLVVDLSQNLPGPLLTSILRDLGARVVKVEPLTGEGLRWLPPHHEGMGVAFGALNVGKQSIAADLKKPEGTALVRALLAKADVLVESFRPGVLARLGLDPTTLKIDFPRLIVCSITGFGQDTGLSKAPGHDITFLARSGLLGLQGPPDAPPAVTGVGQVADVGGGTFPAAIGVLAALLERGQTGRGRHLDIAMARSVLAFNPVMVATALAGDTPRGRDALAGSVPCYRCYATSDGEYVGVGALEPWFWKAMCETAEAPHLLGLQYSFDDDAHRQVAALFATRSQADWIAAFDGVDACVEAVRSPGQALADDAWDPQPRTAGGHSWFPLHMGAPTPVEQAPPSALGADLDAIAESLELDPNLVAAARAAGATPEAS
jgi:crotonobetainyl-CoA:carnitine CoA-transferase CaiB-like acyl-CoA transferase